jgi:hypothetical protein
MSYDKNRYLKRGLSPPCSPSERYTLKGGRTVKKLFPFLAQITYPRTVSPIHYPCTFPINVIRGYLKG